MTESSGQLIGGMDVAELAALVIGRPAERIRRIWFCSTPTGRDHVPDERFEGCESCSQESDA